MSRIVIVGTKSHMDEAIDALYSVEAIHLIDHTVDADEGFSLGTPRPYSPKASERLLKVRAMEKELGITKHVKAESVPEDEIKSQISSDSVELVEKEVLSVLDKRNDLNQRITELNATKRNLELLSDIPVDLELYSGYRSIFGVVGTVAEDPTAALSGINCEIFSSFNKKKGNVIAVFAKVEDKDAVLGILSENGFSEISVPEETGSAASALAKTDRDLTASTAELESVEKEIESLLEKHKSFLKASEEELSIEVQKGEIPVRIANSEYTFVIDAWVPTSKVESVKTEIESKVAGAYVEVEETRGRSMKEVEEAEDRFKDAPTKFNNGKVVKEFQYPTKLVSVPKYQEIDPSILIAIFLPMFFGLMVGDVGYAIPFIILGAYGLKVTKHKDWRAIATVLFFGGIWAFIFGLFFFGECLGMHFIGAYHADGGHLLEVEYCWSMLLGVDNLPSIFEGILPYGTGVGKLFHVGFLL
ncbi:MAG: V-type ATP synthase subunit I, partial [Candidatus Methanomethylophilaceae archaeon]